MRSTRVKQIQKMSRVLFIASCYLLFSSIRNIIYSHVHVFNKPFNIISFVRPAITYRLIGVTQWRPLENYREPRRRRDNPLKSVRSSSSTISDLVFSTQLVSHFIVNRWVIWGLLLKTRLCLLLFSSTLEFSIFEIFKPRGQQRCFCSKEVTWEKILKMEIIGAGFCRSGTMSTQKALQDLGFAPCYHMKGLRNRFNF